MSRPVLKSVDRLILTGQECRHLSGFAGAADFAFVFRDPRGFVSARSRDNTTTPFEMKATEDAADYVAPTPPRYILSFPLFFSFQEFQRQNQMCFLSLIILNYLKNNVIYSTLFLFCNYVN